MRSPAAGEIDALIAQLTDRANTVGAARLLGPDGTADTPGLYSWWCDEAGLALLSEPFEVLLPPLVYAGQAGALSQGRTTNMATLRSRIVGNHLGGNIGSSTFRRTLAAVLLRPLGLVLARPGALDQASNNRLTDWMIDHLSVAIATHLDRARLATVEVAVLAVIDPPLNLVGMRPTPVRRRLTELRRSIAVDGGMTPSPVRQPSRSPTSGQRARLMSDELFARITGAVEPGDIITTLGQGRPNTILAIHRSGIEVETERSSSAGAGPQLVPAWMVERVWHHLVTVRRVTLQHMLASDGLDVKRSAFVAALLARLDDVHVVSTRPVELEYRQRSPETPAVDG